MKRVKESHANAPAAVPSHEAPSATGTIGTNRAMRMEMAEFPSGAVMPSVVLRSYGNLNDSPGSNVLSATALESESARSPRDCVER